MVDADRSILDNPAYPSIHCQDRIHSLCKVHLTINFGNLFSRDALLMKIIESAKEAGLLSCFLEVTGVTNNLVFNVKGDPKSNPYHIIQ